MDRIAVFARWPAEGSVKSRLSPALPPAQACALYRAMLGDTLTATDGAGAGERWLYWADAPAARLGPASPDGWGERDQRGPGLGHRLERAFEELWRAPGDRVVVIGADCPSLDAGVLRSAFEALRTSEGVIGPTRDGGYYLLGLARATPELFRDIDWSTEHVLDQTRERAAAAGLALAALPALEDIDTPADLVRWIAGAERSGPGPALQMAGALAAMGLLPRDAVQFRAPATGRESEAP